MTLDACVTLLGCDFDLDAASHFSVHQQGTAKRHGSCPAAPTMGAARARRTSSAPAAVSTAETCWPIRPGARGSDHGHAMLANEEFMKSEKERQRRANG